MLRSHCLSDFGFAPAPEATIDGAPTPSWGGTSRRRAPKHCCRRRLLMTERYCSNHLPRPRFPGSIYSRPLQYNIFLQSIRLCPSLPPKNRHRSSRATRDSRHCRPWDRVTLQSAIRLLRKLDWLMWCDSSEPLPTPPSPPSDEPGRPHKIERPVADSAGELAPPCPHRLDALCELTY